MKLDPRIPEPDQRTFCNASWRSVAAYVAQFTTNHSGIAYFPWLGDLFRLEAKRIMNRGALQMIKSLR